MIIIKPVFKLDRNLIIIKPIIKAAGIAREAGWPVALWMLTKPAARHAVAAGSREAGRIAIKGLELEPTSHAISGGLPKPHVVRHRDRAGATICWMGEKARRGEAGVGVEKGGCVGAHRSWP